MELTTQERELLKQIVNDKFSVGAFAGMIFNQYQGRDEDLDTLIQQALKVRIRLQELAK